MSVFVWLEGSIVLEVEITRDEIHFGASMTVRFMRTLRVPANGQEHPLMGDLGPLPIFRIEDHLARVPKSWSASPGVFIPVHAHEAMWISFSARPWKPNAVKLAVGNINALTGKLWRDRLTSDPQDYLVCPEQSALTGFNRGDGLVSQFVSSPPGTKAPERIRFAGRDGLGDLRLTVFEPKLGRFFDRGVCDGNLRSGDCDDRDCQMTLTAGGQITKHIQPDPYDTETWDLSNFGQVCVRMVDVAMFREIGCEPPDCPLTRLQPDHPPFVGDGACRE